MIENLNARIWLVVGYVAFSLLWMMPNFVDLPKGWPLEKEKLNYGLDIQGGAHLVYGVDVDGVMEEKIIRMSRGLAREFADKNIAVAKVEPSADKKSIEIELTPGTKDKVLAELSSNHTADLQVIDSTDSKVVVRFYDNVLTEYRSQVISQAIEVIRNRVDEFGVAEPVISAQGGDRVVVQLPGIKDSASAKELINKTAKLNFRIVSRELEPSKVAALVSEVEQKGGYALGKDKLSYTQYFKRVNQDLQGKIPKNTLVAFEKAPSALTLEAGKIPYLLKTDQAISGDLLEDAHVGFGEYGEPVVNFRFGSEGSKQFGELTGNNIREQLAIVLDEVIFSAPSINTRIDGNGQITLGGGKNVDVAKEASVIATALRAGALPAALQQLEERTVGPSLGSDSVEKGKRAGVIGVALVLIFITFYYRGFGAVASVTLLLNVLSLLAVLNALGATITLPGIAGIALTIGMAVDANVIIYERIREEIRRGASRKAAVKEGFDRAWTAIFDANVTTAIAGVVLIYFGSGPVRGFGVTLLAGIFTTMITAVFVTHTLIDVLIQKFKMKDLSI